MGSQMTSRAGQERTGARAQRQWRNPWWIAHGFELSVYTALLALGVIFVGYNWIFGAGWTVQGALRMWDQALAHLSRVLEINPPLRVVRPLSQTAMATLWALPVLCTIVELFGLPLKRIAGQAIWLGVGLATIWLLINALDLVSTVLGFYTPRTDTSTISGWFHGTKLGTGLASVWFTFGPETFGTLIVWGWWRQVQRLRRG